MGMTVYLDVLLLTNLWTDYAMLQTAAHLTHTPLRRLRGILSAMLGAATTLVIFLPAMHPACSILLRLLTAVMMSAAAFGIRDLRAGLLRAAVLFGVSALFSGIIQAISVPHITANAIVYTDLSLTVLLLGSGLAAACAALWNRMRAGLPRGTYRLSLQIGECHVCVPALMDTGNTLCDVFTGRPVIVCPASVLSAWISGFPDSQTAAQSRKGFRMLPVHTVAGMRLLPAFLPDSAALSDGQHPHERPLDVLIAVTDADGEQAIVPAEIMRYARS